MWFYNSEKRQKGFSSVQWAWMGRVGKNWEMKFLVFHIMQIFFILLILLKTKCSSNTWFVLVVLLPSLKVEDTPSLLDVDLFHVLVSAKSCLLMFIHKHWKTGYSIQYSQMVSHLTGPDSPYLPRSDEIRCIQGSMAIVLSTDINPVACHTF